MRGLERYFKALADANSLRILNLLLDKELCVCDIQFVLETSQPNVSRHLAYLKNSGLVIDRRDGYRIYYRLSEPKHVLKKKLFEFLQDAFRNEEQVREDNRLKEAIQEAPALSVNGNLILQWTRANHCRPAACRLRIFRRSYLSEHRTR